MTFEERMDRLTSRHEALTQSVELMLHQQNDLQIKHERRFEEMERLHQKTQTLLTEVVHSIDALSRVAHLHEKRISDLEDRPS